MLHPMRSGASVAIFKMDAGGVTMVVILVLLGVISFLTIDYFVQRATRPEPVAVRDHPLVRRVALNGPLPGEATGLPEIHEVPGGLFVSPWHVWAQLEPSGSVRVGVDKILLSFLGGVEHVYVLPTGTEVRRGGPLLMLRCGHRALRIRSPIDGVVAGVNDTTQRAPRCVGDDPYGRGWLYRISPTGLSEALKAMIVAEDAREWMERELGRLRDLLLDSPRAPAVAHATSADGGVPVEGWLYQIGDRDWEELVAAYFSATEAEGIAASGAAPSSDAAGAA